VFHRDSRFQKLIKEQSIIYHFNIYMMHKKKLVVEFRLRTRCFKIEKKYPFRIFFQLQKRSAILYKEADGVFQ